jgi:hypothetical protein
MSQRGRDRWRTLCLVSACALACEGQVTPGQGQSGTGSGHAAGDGSGAGAGSGGGTDDMLPGGSSYTCDPAAFAHIALPEIAADFAANVYPLMARPTGGCVSCHAPASGRTFLVLADAAQTFARAHDQQLLDGAPAHLLDRVSTTDPGLRMPKGLDAWAQSEVAALAKVVCELGALGTSACASGAKEPGRTPLRRLTPIEYDNTVHDLLGDQTHPGVTTFPAEGASFGFDNNADLQAVDVLRAEKLLAAAENLSATADLASLAPCALQASVPASCGTTFLSAFLPRAFRRPVTPADLAPLQALYDAAKPLYGAATAVRMTLSAVLQAPDFLYRPEFGTGGSAGDVVPLTQYELASRLSYLFWRTMPDATLLAAAAGNQLSTPAQVEAQARRLMAGPAAKLTVAAFHEQWLQLNVFDETDKDAALFPRFAAIKPAMRGEASMFYDDTFWRVGTADTLFLADYTFMNTALAGFYGVGAPAGTGFQKVQLDPAKRLGFLTQAAWLSGHAHENQTDPVQRGKFVREQLLCQQMPAPPSNINVQPPAVTPTTTTRQRFEAHRQAACAACHQLMDPLGFGFEGLDPIGLARTTDNGFPVDDSGEVLSTTDSNGAFHGPLELSRRLAASTQVKTCIATEWFRYGYGHNETSADTCTIDRLSQAFRAHSFDMRELVIALTQTDAFLFRRVIAPGG